MKNLDTDEVLGVWVVVDSWEAEYVTTVHATEADALRTLDRHPDCRVMFLRWGQNVYEPAWLPHE